MSSSGSGSMSGGSLAGGALAGGALSGLIGSSGSMSGGSLSGLLSGIFMGAFSGGSGGSLRDRAPGAASRSRNRAKRAAGGSPPYVKVAWLFPGQGSQEVGMCRALAEQSVEARDVFRAADEALGSSISRLCFEGPLAELTLTANTQPALVATSSALVCRVASPMAGVRRRRRSRRGTPLASMGPSVAAGAFSVADAVRLVRLRGAAMAQEAVPAGVGAMAAIMGLGEADVSAVCEEAAQGEVVSPANFNAPGQIVIAGHAGAVARARGARAEARGGKAIALNVQRAVSLPAHEAGGRAARAGAPSVAISAFAFPVVANVDAAPNADPGRVRDLLVRQIDGPVRWADSVSWPPRSRASHTRSRSARARSSPGW